MTPAGGRAGRWEIRVLGPFTVLRDGVPLHHQQIGSRKARALLKRLVVGRGQLVGIDSLAELLWPQQPPDQPERQIATLVSRLRAALGRDLVVRVGAGYRFAGGPDYPLDLERAERLTAEAEARLAGESGLAYTAAGRAMELLTRGELLAGEPDADWLVPARAAAAGVLRRARRCGSAAALAVGELDAAVQLAEAAIAADPFDEPAYRTLMRAHHGRGETGPALAAYQRLRTALAEELGTDPAEPTRQLHRALLRGEPAQTSEPARAGEPALGGGSAIPDRAARPDAEPGLVGREAELAWLQRAWSRAVAGAAGLALLIGEAGIGKTTLAAELVRLVEATGGSVARARCYEAERSLFLQPLADALRPAVVGSPPELVRAATGPLAGRLAELVSEVTEVLGPAEHQPAAPEVERRRTFEAVAGFLRTFAAHRPLLLFLDDLHLAGSSTLELLHFLVRRAAGWRLLVLATVRVEECGEVVDVLGGLADRWELGPLAEPAVGELARRHGAAELTGQLMARTRGHCLSVVESLRALAEQPAGRSPAVPESLRAAVLERLRRAGSRAEEVLQAAATLGAGIDPPVVAAMLGESIEELGRRLAVAARARLVTEAGTGYEFANDLIREIAYQSTPLPLRIARHRRAAELLAGRPEAVAHHAARAGDWPAAVAAYLRAAEAAVQRYATREAEQLLEQAIAAAVRAEDPAAVARARLARGRVREVLADYQGAYEDHSAVVELARSHGRADLELAALNQLGGDILVGMRRPTRECIPYLEAALALAVAAADVPGQVDILGRLAVIWTNRLRFDRAGGYAERAMALAGAGPDGTVRALALDAYKSLLAYRGEVARLAAVLPPLHRSLLTYRPGLRRYQPAQLRVWAEFESAFPALAQGEWTAAAERIEAALGIARTTGYLAYEPPMLAHLAWLERARGRYGEALRHGRRAVELAGQTGHPWWVALTGTIHGWTLTELGALDQAVACLRGGLVAAERDATEAYLLRCLGHLSWALSRRGDPDRAVRLVERSEAMLGAVTGGVFLHGAHAGLATAAARLELGGIEPAERLLAPIRRAAADHGWVETRAWADLLAARCALAAGDRAPAGRLASAALAATRTVPLPGLAWQAHQLLAELASSAADRERHRAAARSITDELAGSIEDAALREGFCGYARSQSAGARLAS